MLTESRILVKNTNTIQSAIIENRRARWWILIGLVVSAILEVMDTSILNVALPQMAGSLGSTMTDIAWVSTAYLLSNVIVLPMTAWLSQRFGKKNYIITCVIVFSVSRLMCAFSPSLGIMILWRIVQGAAGAALISTSQSVLTEIFPQEQQGMAQALFGVGIVVAPAVAPLLGGWIVDNYSWQVIFYIHIPLAILSCYLVASLYKSVSTPESRSAAGKVDSLGIAFLAIGLGSLQYVLEEGERNDWFSDLWITRMSIASVLGIIALIVWELSPRNKTPVVNLRIYGNRGLWSAVLISFVAGIGMYGINYAFAMFVMYVLRFPSFMAGQALVPMGVGGVLSLLIVAAISNIVDTRITISIGLLCSAIGSWMLGYSSQVTGLEHTWFALGLLGFGTGGSIMPLTIAAFAAVKRSESGDAAAQTGLGRQIGGSFGIAIINTYIKNMSDFHRVRLQEHLTLGNQIFTQQLAGITNMMGQHGFHGVIGQRSALALLSQVLQGQAAIKAYNSGFQLVAMMFGCSVLLVFLLKAPKQVGGKDK